jgi:transcriptional regulatory protein LevR
LPEHHLTSIHSLTKRCFQVARSDIAYLHFIFESYEGLATLSTIDRKNGIVQLSIPHCFEGEVNNLLQSLKTEITITEMPFPEGFTDLWQLQSGQERNVNA